MGLQTNQTHEADRLRLVVSNAQVFHRTLSRLGFTSKHGQGQKKGEWPVIFNAIKYYEPKDAGIIEVDVHRLPRGVKVGRLAADDTLHELSTAIGYPVAAANTRGLVYTIFYNLHKEERLLPKEAFTAVWDPPEKRGGYAVPLGVDVLGDNHWYSMLDIQNTLIGGQPGSGKSTLLHAWVIALTSNPPEDLKLTIIDPKSEFWFWEGIPHLMHPVTDDIADMPAVIKSIVDDANMRRRAIKGVARDFVGYNALRKDARLPLHVVIFDELAVFSLLDESKMIQEIARIAQAGRSLGVFFVFVTQRPGHEISDMMGILKAVSDTRISGRTSTPEDSRIILTKNPDAVNIPRSAPGRIITRVGGRFIELQSYKISEQVIRTIAAKVGGMKFEPHDALTEDEKDLVRFAVDRNHGKFTIGVLYDHFKDDWSKSRLTKLGQTWETRRWLTKPATATEARQVTPELGRLAGVDV